MNIHFLFGTETGSAEMLCEDIRDALGDGFDCEITSLGEVDPATLDADTFYFFVTSTYGNGDLPVTAQPFYDKIVETGQDLSHVRFAIFGLGDMVFSETFAFGSKILMEKLLEQGATMVGERCIHDASSPDMPEDLGIPWAQEIVQQPKAKAA
ncbi:flavodoxin domain-containing protein [Hasllibacter sp. MH4015]|uniref:flavodoxin domain-containing protein n=1 Tax=Hasllibacter sp. MH4015 TaxID=2854029 RepID=UPI001CD335AF|nr:flavodoxin domain-containing protein [Hasllibacter sp. MH4015]